MSHLQNKGGNLVPASGLPSGLHRKNGCKGLRRGAYPGQVLSKCPTSHCQGAGPLPQEALLPPRPGAGPALRSRGMETGAVPQHGCLLVPALEAEATYPWVLTTEKAYL